MRGTLADGARRGGVGGARSTSFGGHSNLGSLYESLVYASVELGRAFEVPYGLDASCGLEASVVGYGGVAGLFEFGVDVWVVSEVAFECYEYDAYAGAVFVNFGYPSVLYVFEADGVIGGEAEHDDVGIGIAEAAEFIKLFLARGVPEAELECPYAI